MNTEQINRFVMLLANIGVLAGIVFLALEIRQSNRIAIAAAEMSVRDHYFANNELVVVNEAVAELLVRAKDTDSAFTDVETERLESYMYMNLNTWRAIEIAYTNGLLPDETFELIAGEIEYFLQGYPGLRPMMQTLLNDDTTPDDRYVSTALRRALQDRD